MKPVSNDELSIRNHQLAEQYHLGQPLGLYNLRPQWIRTYQLLVNFLLLFAIITLVLGGSLVVALIFYIYLTQSEDQPLDFPERLVLGLIGPIVGLMTSVGLLISRRMLVQALPKSVLLCTEGMLVISPTTVDVTRWEEVEGTLLGPGGGKERRYILVRKKRKPLYFNDAFEDLDGLTHQIRHILDENVR